MSENTNQPREKLSLTREQALNILWDDVDPPEFEIIKDKIVGNRRWSVDHILVIKRLKDGKFFKGGYSVGATEEQDAGPWEYTKPNFVEVFPVEKTIIVYV